MKILARISLLFLPLFITSCANENLFLTEQKDGWFKSSDQGLFYCRANIKNDGTADPICFEAAIQVYEDLKPRKLK
jgi:hypothetical protein